MRLITNCTLEIKGPPLTCSLYQVAECARGEGRQASDASLIICVRLRARACAPLANGNHMF